jgi:hypothetical protein
LSPLPPPGDPSAPSPDLRDGTSERLSSGAPPGPPSPPSPARRLRDHLEAPPRVAIALLAALLFVKLQSLVPTLFDHDGYYHIEVAALMRAHGPLRALPWAAFSMFRDHFGDKELLFHAFLIPFTWLGLIPGAKLATVLLDTAIVTLTYHLLRVHRARAPGLWMLLFVSAASLFYWRMGQCRPHLGSILCVLAGLHLLARRRPIALAALSAVYALAYTASHVILILALGAAVLHRLLPPRPAPVQAAGAAVLHRLLPPRPTPVQAAGAAVLQRLSLPRLALELPLAALLGLAAGFALHPAFPHNLVIWKIQNVDFYRFAWAKDLLGLGTEIQPLAPLEFLANHLVLLSLWTFIGGLALWRWRRLTYETAVFAMGGAAFGVLAFTGARFTEYWVPLSVMALAMMARDLELGVSRLRARWLRGSAIAGAGAVLALSTVSNLGDAVRYLTALAPAREVYDASLRDIGAILAREASGEIVYHSAWSDAPALMLFNDRSRYLVVLDPIYFYTADPRRYLAFRTLNEGGTLPEMLRPLATPETPDRLEVVPTLRHLFDTRFVVARADHTRLIDALSHAPGVVVRYRSITHVLFELPKD